MIKGALLWLLPAPLSRHWSFSHQIRLAGRVLRRKGIDVIFSRASIYPEIKPLIEKKKISSIMLHGYPDMFPFLFEDVNIRVPVFLWAQVSGPALARRYNEIKIKELCLIPLTPLSRQFFVKSGFPRVTEVIPHMVDIEVFRPLSRENKKRLKTSLGLDGKFVLGKIGANCLRKRLKDLIAIYAELKTKINPSVLILKTNRVSAEGEDLGKMAGALGVGRGVIFMEDYLGGAELNKVYNSLNLYCNVSEWEGFGLTVAEAMASKVPVLSHLTQGPGEYLPYKEFLVPSGRFEKIGETEIGLVDREEFKTKILFAHQNPDILNEFVERGYRYILENFSPEVVANKFLQLTYNFN